MNPADDPAAGHHKTTLDTRRHSAKTTIGERSASDTASDARITAASRNIRLRLMGDIGFTGCLTPPAWACSPGDWAGPMTEEKTEAAGSGTGEGMPPVGSAGLQGHLLLLPCHRFIALSPLAQPDPEVLAAVHRR